MMLTQSSRRATRILAVILVVVLMASTLGPQSQFTASAAFERLKPQRERSIPGTLAPPPGAVPDDPAAAAALKGALPEPNWPAAGSVTVDLSPLRDPHGTAPRAIQAGSLPVSIGLPWATSG